MYRHMRDGSPIETPMALRLMARENQSPTKPHIRRGIYRRVLEGIPDRKHSQYGPMHNLEFTHGGATTARSTSAPPSTQKTVETVIANLSTRLEIVPETSPSDEEPRYG